MKESNHVDPTPAGARDHSDLGKSAGFPQLTVRGHQFFICHSEEPSCIHAPSSKRVESSPAECGTFCCPASIDREEIFPFETSRLLYVFFLCLSQKIVKKVNFFHGAPKERVVDVNCCCRFCLMSFVRVSIVRVRAKGHSSKHVSNHLCLRRGLAGWRLLCPSLTPSSSRRVLRFIYLMLGSTVRPRPGLRTQTDMKLQGGNPWD